MSLKVNLLVLISGILLLTGTNAEAQFRQNRTRPRTTTSSQTGLNPVHEKTKEEAQAALGRGEFQRTIDLTSSVIRSNSRDDVAYYLRASAHAELGLMKKDVKLLRRGIADAREAIRLKGRKNSIYYIPYFYGMTSLATLEDRPEHAEVVVTYATKVINQAGIKEMDKAHLLYQRGRANVVLQKQDEAIADFAAAAKALPDQLSFQLELADAYARVGKSDKAIETFEAAIKSFPDLPVVYNNRGMFLQRQGKPAEAIADFTQALELNPKFYFALTNRGFSLLKSGDATAAENDLTATLKLNSNQPRAYGLRASARLSLGRIEEGIADHEKSVELDPKNPIAWADLGYARFFAGRYADSVTAFDQAIELDEGRRYLNPWRYLAMAKAGEGDAAKEKFTELIQADAAKRDWIDHLLVFLSGQIDGDTLIKSVNMQPSVKTAQLCEAHFFIAEMQTMTGETDAAAEHFKLAIDTGAKQLAAYRGASFALKKVATSSGSN